MLAYASCCARRARAPFVVEDIILTKQNAPETSWSPLLATILAKVRHRSSPRMVLFYDGQESAVLACGWPGTNVVYVEIGRINSKWVNASSCHLLRFKGPMMAMEKTLGGESIQTDADYNLSMRYLQILLSRLNRATKRTQRIAAKRRDPVGFSVILILQCFQMVVRNHGLACWQTVCATAEKSV